MIERDANGKPSATKRMILMLVGSLTVFGGIFALKALISVRQNQYFDTMSFPPSAVSAQVARTELWSEQAEAVGSFVAVNGTDVTTEAGGVIREILFSPGQRVKAGTVLVRLNAANEAATLRALEAAADQAVAQRDRWRQLSGEKLVSRAEVEQRSADADAALAQVEAQRALIAQKTIRAPFDGILGIRKVNLGQYLSPGSPIVNLQSLDPIFLDFALPQQRLGQVAEGTIVRATVDSMPGRVFEGRITAIEPQIDARTRNFKVQATFLNTDTTLRPGLFAKVGFDLGGERPVVVIPQTAISFNPYGNSVYVIEASAGAATASGENRGAAGGAGGKGLVVKQRFIKTGAARGDMIVVTEGLKAGEQVVTSGLLKLRNGAPVTINNKIQPTADTMPAPGNT